MANPTSNNAFSTAKKNTLNLMHGDVIIMVMSLSRNGGTGLGKSYCGNDTDVIFLYLIFVSV